MICTNQRAAAVIGVTILLGLLGIPAVRADWVYTGTTYDGTLEVSGHDYAYVSSFHFAGQRVAITFDCVGGDEKIDFVVCDAGNLFLLESQYNSWELQGSFIGYLQSIHFGGPLQVERVSSWMGEFEIPHTGSWFYLFSNVFALTSKTVQLSVEAYQWRDSVLLAVVSGVLVFGVLAAVTGIVIHRRRKQS